MLFYSGIIHFLLRGREICKSFLGKVFALGGHEIPYSFLNKLFYFVNMRFINFFYVSIFHFVDMKFIYNFLVNVSYLRGHEILIKEFRILHSMDMKFVRFF